MAGELNAAEIADLGSRRRQIRERHDIGQAQNAFNQQVALREGGRGSASLVDQYNKAREQIPYSFAARGLSNSGLKARGIFDLNKAVGQQATDLQGRLQDQLQGLSLVGQQLTTVQNGGLRDIDEMEAGRISAVAAALRAAGVS